MADNNDEDVGYRKPPRKSRFKKGQSGNPSGRPVGPRNRPDSVGINEMILKEAGREIQDKSGKTYPTIQALVRALNVKAVQGDTRALGIALKVVQTAERDKTEVKRAAFQQAREYKEDCNREADEALAAGRPRPKFHIDPDDITLDPVSGDVTVSTLTEEEHDAIIALHNYRWHLLQDILDEAKDLTSRLPTAHSEQRSRFLSSIEHYQALERRLGGPFLPMEDGSMEALDFEVLTNLSKNEKD